MHLSGVLQVNYFSTLHLYMDCRFCFYWCIYFASSGENSRIFGGRAYILKEVQKNKLVIISASNLEIGYISDIWSAYFGS